MIHIYCLIDPRNNKPFYVGATKMPLKNRLSAHIHTANSYRHNKYSIMYTNSCKKNNTIKDIISFSQRPKIELLKHCTNAEAEYYEYFFFKALVNQGFDILNTPSLFNYLKYIKNT